MPYKKLVSNQYSEPPFLFKVLQGRAGRYFAFTKFGSNLAVTNTEADIWQTGGTMEYLASDETMTIVSSSGDDSSSGTGAQAVQILALDSDFTIIRETISLDGVTPVVTTGTFTRIFRMTVSAVGASGVNVGNITISATTSGFNQGTALIGIGKTLKTQFTVPDGLYGVFMGWTTSDLSNDQVTFRVRVREEGGMFVVRRQLDISGTSFEENLNVPFVVPPKADIKLTGQRIAGVAMATTNASYGMVLVDSREIQTLIDEDII